MESKYDTPSFLSVKKKKQMRFIIPMAFAPVDKVKKRSVMFKRFVGYKKDSSLGRDLHNTGVDLTREDYLAICLGGLVNAFLIVFVISSTLLILMQIQRALLISLGLSLMFGGFVFFSRYVYPHVFNNRKQRNIEKNLIPALQDMLVQLHSGVPLFTIMINISLADYQELSEQFKKAVKEINGGRPQIEVLEQLGKDNPSEFFRRALWQLSNGMRAGSDISIVIQDSVKSLGEEQYIQIQEYGNKLNPAIMFYMLACVILPALGITFLTIISSMIGLGESTTKGIFIGLFVGVMFIEIMFLGVIKGMRPSLL